MGDITGFLRIKRKEAGNRPYSKGFVTTARIEQILNSEDRMLQASVHGLRQFHSAIGAAR
jgi:hypothetical protein